MFQWEGHLYICCRYTSDLVNQRNVACGENRFSCLLLRIEENKVVKGGGVVRVERVRWKYNKQAEWDWERKDQC